MNRHFILFAIVFLSVCSGFAKTFDIDISTGRPAAANEAYYHGETIEFRAVRGRSVVTNVEYSCVYYQTNGMDSVWWHTDGLVFHPTNDVGAASYRFFLEGRDEIGRDWHANGTLRLLPSPGFEPSAVQLPVKTLDFADIEVSNAPWATPDDVATAAGVAAQAAEDLSAHASATNNPHHVTAAQVGISITPISNGSKEISIDGSGVVIPSVAITSPEGGGTVIEVNEERAVIPAVDVYPEYHSNNPVSSGGVYSRLAGKQATITAEGLLKGDGSGGVETAVAGTDYIASLASATNYTDAVGVAISETADARDARNLRDLTRAYRSWREPSTPVQRGSGHAVIFFKPSAFGATAACTIREFTLRTSDNTNTALPSGPVYAKIIDPDAAQTAMAVARPVTMTRYDTNYTFVFDTDATLTATKQYKIVFYSGAADGSPMAGVPVRLSENKSANQEIYYEGLPTYRPIMGFVYSDSLVAPRLEAAEVKIANIAAYLNGDDVRVVVTNYDSQVHMPSLSIQQRSTNNVDWATIWDEGTRWASNDVALAEIREGKADRAWGFYDSHTGGYAPDGYTWVSSTHVAIAGGLAYQRFLTSGGAVWVLESNGMVADVGGTTNGFFRISDDEGNVHFEIVKGDRRIVGATAGSINVSDDGAQRTVTIGYAVAAAEHPTIYCTADIRSEAWLEEGESGCPASVSWSGASGSWTATLATSAPALFVKATYAAGQETYIRNSSPVQMQRLILNGVTYTLGTATIGGSTVLTLTPEGI